MKKRAYLFFLISLLLLACSPKEDTAKQGEALFNQKHIGKNRVIGCVSCHSITPGQIIVGPSLAGLKHRAGYLEEGLSAKEYIKNSIINPDSFIVNGFLPATMYSHYKDELSNKEIEQLVAYLSQLE